MTSAPVHRKPLAHLMPGWFAAVMGIAGLALAWHRAVAQFGEVAGAVSLVAGAVALLVFVALGGATLLRAARHPAALREDLAHPVRHAFFAAIPISLLLLVTLAVAHHGPAPWVAALWGIGAAAQWGVTLWVLARWLRAAPPAGGPAWNWAGITPALFIPVVGNVLVPLAGVPLGYPALSAAQFGLGLLFWPVVMVLIVVRLGQAGPLPERMLPTVFIFVAPPAVIGLAALQFGSPASIVWMLWGMALSLAAWAATLARRIAALPFGVPHWGMSFPLAALAALTLRLAEGEGAAAFAGGWLRIPAIALLALVSLVIVALALATVRGLRAGTLLVPEPAAPPATPPQAGAAAR